MRSTFKILYYINRGKVKANGTTAIMCRITIDGKNSVFATGCYCNPKDWKAKTGEVRDARTNNLLEALRSRIETSYDNLLKDAGMVTAEMLKNEITCVTTVHITESRRRGTGKVENPFRSDKFHFLLPPVQILTGIPARISAVAGYAGHRF